MLQLNSCFCNNSEKEYSMKISHRQYNDVDILDIEGSLSIDRLDSFEHYLQKYYNDNKSIILNITDVEFIDSSSLGLIVSYYNQFLKKNLRMVLYHPKKNIMKVLNITGLSARLVVFKSLEKAIKHIQSE